VSAAHRVEWLLPGSRAGARVHVCPCVCVRAALAGWKSSRALEGRGLGLGSTKLLLLGRTCGARGGEGGDERQGARASLNGRKEVGGLQATGAQGRGEGSCSGLSFSPDNVPADVFGFPYVGIT
jgi:hypothetical protein